MSQNQSLNTKKHFFTHLKKCFSLVYRLHQTAARVRLSAIKYSFQREITQERETVNTRETTHICRKADSTSRVLQWLRHGCSCLLGGGRVVRWCWVNFQCRGVLQFGFSRARAYCACSRCGWGVVWTFLLSSILSLLFLPLFGRRPDID